jgi:hypothetical protein
VVVVTLAAGRATAADPPTHPAQRAPVVVEVRGEGFHWGDAAVGAAAALGLTLAGAGVLVLTRSTVSQPEGNNHA